MSEQKDKIYYALQRTGTLEKLWSHNFWEATAHEEVLNISSTSSRTSRLALSYTNTLPRRNILPWVSDGVYIECISVYIKTTLDILIHISFLIIP